MKRREVVQALLTADTENIGPADPELLTRVSSSAVRAMGLELGRLTEQAREAEVLRQQMEAGETVVELDPSLIEPCFVSDRLSRTADQQYRRLVDSIRDYKQQVPILVRPHPQKPDRFQMAYGHRRCAAAIELGIRVRAVVRGMSDEEVVIAQGKENAERRNLSFIERAVFAAELEQRGFARSTLNAALGVHTAEMTRLLSVAATVPVAVVHAIGPSPKAGRPRWQELARHLQHPDAIKHVYEILQRPGFRQMNTDRRFEMVLESVRSLDKPLGGQDVLPDTEGERVWRMERAGRIVKFIIDEDILPDFGNFVMKEMSNLVARFEAIRRTPPLERDDIGPNRRDSPTRC